jgi:hypothetical protein
MASRFFTEFPERKVEDAAKRPAPGGPKGSAGAPGMPMRTAKWPTPGPMRPTKWPGPGEKAKVYAAKAGL